MQNHYAVLAYSSEEQLDRLAGLVLEEYNAAQVRLLSGPQPGLVMLRVKETVADSQFNAGEILVTEARLELDGQFGFAMLTGDRPRAVLAIALVDAALRKAGRLAERLQNEIARLATELEGQRRRQAELVGATRVDFETM